MTLAHNAYFNDAVQSIAYTHDGEKVSVGVMAPGEYHFGTDAPERMTVVTGSLRVRLPGADWAEFPAGTSFEVPGAAGFDLEVSQPSAYLCEYLPG